LARRSCNHLLLSELAISAAALRCAARTTGTPSATATTAAAATTTSAGTPATTARSAESARPTGPASATCRGSACRHWNAIVGAIEVRLVGRGVFVVVEFSAALNQNFLIAVGRFVLDRSRIGRRLRSAAAVHFGQTELRPLLAQYGFAGELDAVALH